MRYDLILKIWTNKQLQYSTILIAISIEQIITKIFHLIIYKEHITN